MQKYLILLGVLALLVVMISGKVFEGTINIATFRKTGSWHYLGRMTLRPGKANLDLNI